MEVLSDKHIDSLHANVREGKRTVSGSASVSLYRAYSEVAKGKRAGEEIAIAVYRKQIDAIIKQIDAIII